MTDQQLKENFSARKPHRGSYISRMGQYRKLIGWTVAGLVVVVIALFGLYYFRGDSRNQPESHRSVKTVFRAKIEMAKHQPKPPVPLAKTIQEEDIPERPPLKNEALQPAAEKPIVVTKVSEPPPVPKPSTESQTIVEKQKSDKHVVHREDWLLSQKSSSYTIQILGVRNKKYLLEFIETKLTPRTSVIAYYKTSYRGKIWYPLLYGVYATKKEASSTMKQLPPKLQIAVPWIRKMSFIQKAIRKRRP